MVGAVAVDDCYRFLQVLHGPDGYGEAVVLGGPVLLGGDFVIEPEQVLGE